MVAATTTPVSLDIGRVINRAFQVIGRNFVTFLALAVIAQAPYLALTLALSAGGFDAASITANTNIAALAGYIGGIIVTGLAALVLTFVLQAALAHGTVADLNGRRATFGECLRTGIREALPLLAIGVLDYLGVVLGLLLLVVPGIMLTIAWAVVAPVRVIEHSPVFDTFGRSAALTRGYRWPVFGLFVIYGIAAAVIGFVVLPLAGFGEAGGAATATTIGLIAQSAVRVATSLVLSTGVASLYYELRSIKEGIGPEHLAAVFD